MKKIKKKLSEPEAFISLLKALGLRKTWKRNPATKIEESKKRVYKRSANKSLSVLSTGDDNDGDYL